MWLALINIKAEMGKAAHIVPYNLFLMHKTIQTEMCKLHRYINCLLTPDKGHPSLFVACHLYANLCQSHPESSPVHRTQKKLIDIHL